MHMHAAEFGTAMQGRKHLAGVEQPLRIEGAFDPLLLIEVDLAEHLRHQVALFDTNAMLTGQNATEFDAGPQDIGAKRLGAFDLAGLIGVIENERVQIAVAGMEHVGTAQIVFL